MPNGKLNFLSDNELQRKLAQNGFQNTPVTETTRPILIKKLMIYLKRKTSNGKN